MHDEDGLAIGAAADLLVKKMSVADIEHAATVRLDRRVSVGHGGHLLELMRFGSGADQEQRSHAQSSLRAKR